jgi:hypothetical protein
MKLLLVALLMLSGCTAHTVRAPDHRPDVLHLETRQIERSCGVAEGSLLHPTSSGDIEVWSTAGADLAYAKFACVWAAVQNARLSERGIKVILVGEVVAG